MSDFKQLHVRTYSVVLKSQGCTSPPLLYNTNKNPLVGVWWTLSKVSEIGQSMLGVDPLLIHPLTTC